MTMWHPIDSGIPIRRLTAHNVELDLSPDKFGWLSESSDRDPGALRQCIDEEGYVFIRNFWSRDEVQRVRDSLTTQLAQMRFLASGSPPDEARSVQGRDVGRAIGNPLDQQDPAVRALLFGPRMISFLERFLGGPVRHLDFIWFRTKGPGLGSPLHCDLVYMGRGTHNLFTAWVPIGDVDLELGGLIVLEDSHRKSDDLRQYLSRDVDTYCTNQQDAADYAAGKKWWDGTLSKNATSLRDSLGGRWLTAHEYRMGDILIFNMTLVHGSLDNHTDRIRLSTDTRYQLAAERADERWIGRNPLGHSTAMKHGRIC